MTSVPTTSLLISSDGELLLEALSDLGRSGGNLINKVAEINSKERGGILLFSNQANPNFISLEHTFMESEQKIVIKFIDPKGEFETNYFSPGSMWRDLTAKSALERERNKKLRQVRNRSKDSAKDLPEVDYKVLSKIVSNSSTKPMYIAYGVSNDPATWSTVHRVIMTGIVFDNNASREFTLTLAPYPRSLNKQGRIGIFSQQIDMDTMGFDLAAEGESQRIRFENAGEGKVYAYKNSPYSTDYHFLITDAIVDYIRKASGGANVIVLFPDLNKILDQHIEKLGSQESGGDIADQLRNTIDSLMSSLNLSLKAKPNYRGKFTKGNAIPSQYYSFQDSTKPKSGLQDSLYNNKKQANYYNTYDFHVRLSSENSSEGVPDFLEPLKNVFSSLKKYSSTGYTMDTVYFTETDLRLLKFWGSKTNKNKLTFNGKYTFDENIPTVVIGDPNLISNLLCPREDQEKMPLDIVHPINSRELITEDYTSGIQKILKVYMLGKSVFGNINQVPDIFQYKDDVLSEEGIDLIEKNKIPVFRHNTSEPNVTKIKVADEANAYFANLSLGYAKQIERLAVQLIDGKAAVRIRDYKISSIKSLINAINRSRYSNFGPTLTKEKIIKDVESRVDTSLKEKIVKEGEYESVASYIKAILDNTDEEKSLQLKISQEVNAEPAVMVDKFATQLANQTTKIVVNTLPLCSISSKTIYQFSPAVVFSQDLPMQGQVFPRRTRFNNYLTGVYQIVGWKHSLGSSKAESVFVLAKINNSSNLGPIPAEGEGQGASDLEAQWLKTMEENSMRTREQAEIIKEQMQEEEEEAFKSSIKDFIEGGKKVESEPESEATSIEVEKPVPIEYTEADIRPPTNESLPINEDGTADDLINREEPFTEAWRIRNDQIDAKLKSMGTTGRRKLGDN